MTKEIIIFGAGDIAELANYYFTHDSEYDVVAYTVDREFMPIDSALELPVVPFDEISKHYPPEQYSLFIALSYSKSVSYTHLTLPTICSV